MIGLKLNSHNPSSAKPKRVTIICNPFAGKGLATNMAKEAERFSIQKNWRIVANVQSEYAGHIENELACKYADDTDLIILIGGDGTLRELIAGLRQNLHHTEIAFIPMGNANVVARELNIPLKPGHALQMLETSTTTLVDIGILEMKTEEDQNTINRQSMIFLAMLEIGFGAKIVHIVNQLRLGKLQRLYHLWGDLVYAIAGILAFMQKNPDVIDVEQNNQKAKSKHIIVSNMQTYAKGWSLTPEANCQDGLLDIAINKKGSRISTLATFLLAAQRKRSPDSRMAYSQASEVVLKGSPKTFMQVDGDPIYFSGFAKVRIEPKAFNLHVPIDQKL
ncbi:MAG: diacylglycerol kinase (ATP) [Oleiphilaceae bacterium]